MTLGFVVFGTVILVALSLWGWGFGMRRCARAPAMSVALTCAVGLAAIIVLGGVLNLIGVAYGPVLDGLLIMGLALAVAGLVGARKRTISLTRGDLLAAIPALALSVFLVSALFPWAAYNHHDDLERYLAYPARMLATGTLAGNPLGYMGGDSLGGQSFLQGIVAAHAPMAHIGSMDTVFGLAMCMGLAGFAVRPTRWAVGAIVAELAVVAINPQIVNVSSVYTSAALILATVMMPGAGSTIEKPGTPPRAFLMGLLFAALISLKTTTIVFVAAYALSLAAVGPGERGSRMRWLLAVTLWTLALLLPWALLHRSLYFAPARPPIIVPEGAAREPLNLFSIQTLYYGSAQFAYTAMAIAATALTSVALSVNRGREGARSWPARASLAAALASAGSYFALVAIGGPLTFGVEAATRYACPILIGVIPALVRLAETPEVNHGSLVARFWPLGLAVTAVAGFASSAVQRFKQISDSNLPLAYFSEFSTEQRRALLAYTREVFDPAARARLAAIQALVPAGEGLGAWVMTPFLLDFARNPIWHTDPYGLGMRWARLPENCRYFLLEHDGYAVRPFDYYRKQLTAPGLADRVVAARVLDFIQSMENRLRRGKTLYTDASFLLVRLAD